jgi:hypothetical protein
MRFAFYATFALWVLGGCSFDTAALIRGAPRDASTEVGSDAATDTPSDVAADAPSDVATDTPADVAIDTPADVAIDRAPADVAIDRTPADVAVDASPEASVDAGRSAVGLWRITRTNVFGLPPSDTGVNRINGLLRVAPFSASLAFANVQNDRAHLTRGITCPSDRTIDFSGRGLNGVLDDTMRAFTSTEGATPARFTYTWITDDSIEITYRYVFDFGFTVARIAEPAPRPVYAGTIQIEFGDTLCPNVTPAGGAVSAVLLWEQAPGGTVAIAQAAATRLSPSTDGRSAQFAVSLRDNPPAGAIGRADGIGAAIAYIVVFGDTNGDGRLDHPWTGGSGETVYGLSNVAIAWRASGVTHRGDERSSFIDTFPGYQTVTIGPDSRSDGGSSPWTLDSTTRVQGPTGCFAADPTIPIFASGPVQMTAVTGALPDLLR